MPLTGHAPPAVGGALGGINRTSGRDGGGLRPVRGSGVGARTEWQTVQRPEKNEAPEMIEGDAWESLSGTHLLGRPPVVAATARCSPVPTSPGRRDEQG